jgi:hypothetical protein
VADLIRAAGTTFFERSRKWFTWWHLKILTAIVCCRSSTLGGHLDECSRCGHQAISFNSCRNRHCPKCQSNARDRWLEARRKELLPVRYVHAVFTLPGQLAPLALQNKSEFYDLLFRLVGGICGSLMGSNGAGKLGSRSRRTRCPMAGRRLFFVGSYLRTGLAFPVNTAPVSRG